MTSTANSLPIQRKTIAAIYALAIYAALAALSNAYSLWNWQGTPELGHRAHGFADQVAEWQLSTLYAWLIAMGLVYTALSVCLVLRNRRVVIFALLIMLLVFASVFGLMASFHWGRSLPDFMKAPVFGLQALRAAAAIALFFIVLRLTKRGVLT